MLHADARIHGRDFGEQLPWVLRRDTPHVSSAAAQDKAQPWQMQKLALRKQQREPALICSAISLHEAAPACCGIQRHTCALAVWSK